MRGGFFILSLLCLFPTAVGWADVSRISASMKWTVDQVDQAQRKLKSFEVDADGNVPPEERRMFELAKTDPEKRTAYLRDTTRALHTAKLFAYAGTAGLVGFFVLGFIGLKRKAAEAQSVGR